MPQNMLTLTAVRGRGWTPRMIEELLGEPDGVKQNPRRRSSQIKLYNEARVTAVERTGEFAELSAASESRVKAAREAAKSKRATLLAEIDAIGINLPQLPVDELRRLGVASWESRGGIDGAGAHEAIKDRWAVNFARHSLTAYDADLDAVFARVGAAQARQRLKRRVLEAIAAQWPELSLECQRQIQQCEQLD